ncbi:MAG: hypothetical protein ACHQFX_12690 [Chitinophagales bacterium]
MKHKEDKTNHFQTFSDTRLIEIVRNARQFGYDETIRNAALRVLKERGISEQDLQLTGNLNNYKYDYTRNLFISYIANSRIAFVCYIALIIYKGLTIFHIVDVDPSGAFNLLFELGLFLLFLLFLTMSFVDHMNFYRSIDKRLGTGDQIIYFLVGMPLYIFMYFFYKSQMKEEMLMVH